MIEGSDNMNCKDFDLYGSAYIDNMLSEQERLEFENHINECEYCNISLQNLKIIVESINELEEVELPRNFSSELTIKLQNEKNSKNRMVFFNKKKLLSGIVAGLLIFMASLSLINNSLINKNMDRLYSEIEDKHINEKNTNFKIASDEPKDALDNTEKETTIKPSIMAMDNVDEKQEGISEESAKQNKDSRTYNIKTPENEENSVENKNSQNQLTKKRFSKTINPFAIVSIILGVVILIYKIWKK